MRLCMERTTTMDDRHAAPAPAPAIAALVAETQLGDRTTLHTILVRLGIRPVHFRPGCDPVPLITEQNLGLLLLDLHFPGLDIAGCVRRLRQDPRTARLPVLVTCPPTVDRARLRDLVAAGVSGVVLKPLSVDALEQKLAPLVRPAQPVPAAAAGDDRPGDDPAAAADGKTAARRVQDNNSLLVRDAFCPCHKERVLLRRYTLRTGHVQAETTFFDITHYTAAAPKADFVDFNLLAVTVCPTCFFASNDPDYFPTVAAGKSRGKVFSAAAVAALNAGAAARGRSAASASHDFFNHRRTAADGLLAYRLAIETSSVLHKGFLHEFPLEPLRLANCYFRVAHLLQRAGAPDDVQQACYVQAVPFLKEAFARMEGALLYKTVYQLVAVGIYLRDDGTAVRYLEHLRALERDRAHPPADGPALQRCLARSQEAWENREYHRSPVPAEAPAAIAA
jgi:CheY-like chemotaxis protein